MQLETSSQFRELAGRNARVGSGQYVVYFFLAKSLVRCTPEGEMLTAHNEMGYVFDDLSAARHYCHWKVNENPKLGCTVYDSNRKVADQIFSSEHVERTKRGNDPKRQALLGTLSLLCGCSLIWIDARHDWLLIIGFLIGIRLAIGGAAKLALSIPEFYKKR
jgi:hypothetical protein